MKVLSITQDFTGSVGTQSRQMRLVIDDTLANFTAANYLLPLKSEGYTFGPLDTAQVTWPNSNVPSTWTSAFFNFNVLNGGVQLTQESQGNIIGPVVPGDVAVFSNDSGALADGGLLGDAAYKNTTNNALAFVAASSGASVIGDVAIFSDTHGSITNSNIQPSDSSKPRMTSMNGTAVVGNIPIFSDILGTITDSGLSPSESTFVWNGVSGTTQTIAGANGYWTENGALTTFTLPTTLAAGEIFSIAGVSAGGWTLHQNAGQQIRIGTASTTSGAGGSLSSTAQGDCISVLCDTANTHFTVLNSRGNITYV